MIYSFFKYILRFYLPLFFKKIKIRGIENIPLQTPFILAVNHKNAFMDGYLSALMLKRNIYFLTRSDVFKGKIVKSIFKILKLIPIYRKQDGSNNPQTNNATTFQFCYEALKDNKPILIFPEGISEPVHELFPIKKGLARIALGAEEAYNFGLDLKIIPTVINYEHHFSPRKTVELKYLKPISVKDYQELYINHPAKGINQLTQDVFSVMKREVYKISPAGGANSPGLIYFFKGLSLSYLPTALITYFIVKKINDDSFFLSAIATLWLLLGMIEITCFIGIAFLTLPLTGALIATAIKVILGFVLLLNGRYLITKDY